MCYSTKLHYKKYDKQLSELDGSRVSEYDPSDGMETVEELKKYVRFLYASLQEKDRENLQMKKDMSDIKGKRPNLGPGRICLR